MIPVAILTAALLSGSPPAPARRDTETAEPLRVQITTPQGGWTSDRLVLIAGTVSDPAIRSARILLNRESFTVNVHEGRFEVRLPVLPGENVAEVIVRSGATIARDQVAFSATGTANDVVVLLTWDTLGTDLDLRVTDPEGIEVYYGARRSPGGGVLEVDDTDGYGPEVFVVPRSTAGEYRIAISYYDAAGLPQTEARVEVIMSGGTSHERRVRFAVTLTHEGETLDVGTFRFESPR